MRPFVLEQLLSGPGDESLAILVAGGATWSRQRLRVEAEGWTRCLASLRLPEGSPLAIWAANSPAWIAAALGGWALGHPIVPVSPRWTDREVAVVMERVGPALLLGDPPLVERARRLGLTARRLEEARTNEDRCGAAVGPLAPDRPAAILPTSGTTGTPKLAVLTAGGLGATAASTAAALGLGPGSVYALPMPLWHVGGLGAVCRALGAGAALALPAPDPGADLLAAWQEAGVTHASLVPTQVRDLTPGGRAAWPASLRVVLVGGASPPMDLADRCPTGWVTYGLTEAGGTVTLSPASRAGGTAGLPLPGWEVRVVDLAGVPVPAGAPGEVAVRGPGLMHGYLGDAAATQAALVGGWLLTGDIGVLDLAGRLTILSRRSDLIVSGGENVYPAEVESALLEHPDIDDVAVIGEPDARWGQRVVACIVLRDGAAPLELEALRVTLAQRLAGYKHPRRLDVLTALPRLVNGKVDRLALRARTEGARV